MTNIVVTSTATTVKAVFNDYADHQKIKQASYRRNDISEIVEHTDGEHLTIIMLNGNEFDLSFNSVDSVDGVAPTSNDDLFNKLVALQQV